MHLLFLSYHDIPCPWLMFSSWIPIPIPNTPHSSAPESFVLWYQPLRLLFPICLRVAFPALFYTCHPFCVRVHRAERAWRPFVPSLCSISYLKSDAEVVYVLSCLPVYLGRGSNDGLGGGLFASVYYRQHSPKIVFLGFFVLVLFPVPSYPC